MNRTVDNYIDFVNRMERRGSRLTPLAMFLCPAALAEQAVDGGLKAGGLPLGRPWADVSALAVVLVRHDVVVLYRVQDLGPVQGGEVAKVRVLLHAHRAPGDVHEA